MIQQAQNEVRNAQANIKFLEDELAKMQMSSPGGSGGGGGGGGSVSSPDRSGSRQQQQSMSMGNQGPISPSKTGSSGHLQPIGQLFPAPDRTTPSGRPLPPSNPSQQQGSSSDRALPPVPIPGQGNFDQNAEAYRRAATGQGDNQVVKAGKNASQLGESFFFLCFFFRGFYS